MPSPGAPAPPRVLIEDSYLELLVDTLDALDLPARGQFLQRYFRVIAHLDLREAQCLQIWDDMLARRRDLAIAPIVRFLSTPLCWMSLTRSGLLRVPILIEYEDLKKTPAQRCHRSAHRSLQSAALRRNIREGTQSRAPLWSAPGLVMLDLHRFKEVNDKHGHPRGDEVLRAAAATLKKALRTSDYAFRIGGDEFALLLPQTDAEQALALARRVETVFCGSAPAASARRRRQYGSWRCQFPAGWRASRPVDRIADERLYRLKHTNHSRKGNGSPRTVTPDAQEEPPAAPAPPPVDRTAADPSAYLDRNETRARKTESAIEAAASATAAEISANLPAPSPRAFAVQRKAERVSMTGTNA